MRYVIGILIGLLIGAAMPERYREQVREQASEVWRAAKRELRKMLDDEKPTPEAPKVDRNTV